MISDINLINFTNLNEKEKLMILSWRNNPGIKKWMYTSENISVENHFHFIQRLKKMRDKLYFVVKKNNEYLGVIDFTNIQENNSAVMGIYINPKLKGLGKMFMQIIISYGFKELRLNTIFSEVFENNEKALILYKKFGFEVFNKKVINERNVICMELKNEHR